MILKLEGIRKKFGKAEVLRNISFSVESGSCIGILGKNGSGKSTLLSILAGLTKADGGRFEVDGRELFSEKKLSEKIVGYVAQGTPLIEELSGRDNLSLFYSGEKLRRELGEGVLKELGINKFVDKTVSKMSGGMKKRLSIGMAVSCNPQILLLDEPSAALDLDCKETIASYLDSFKRRGGIAIMSTHDIQDFEICDRLFILSEGVLSEYIYDGDLKGLSSLIAK